MDQLFKLKFDAKEKAEKLDPNDPDYHHAWLTVAIHEGMSVLVAIYSKDRNASTALESAKKALIRAHLKAGENSMARAFVRDFLTNKHGDSFDRELLEILLPDPAA